ncbi:MAG TPA: cytochrome c biogenesis protein ResB [Candidatus Sulfotelmatobacter sp.]|jgi:cytochrome c biogenesis protein|nr:cytochrome c biogenesis protein ResB [Candidatus Sulfotelmatobacter sp.]
MAGDSRTIPNRVWRTIASIQTGVVLLILVVILAAVGTIVLQRPVTDPDEMQSAYSPQALRVLDKVGLTDVFHSWWFLGLVLLVSISIVAASIDRFPNSWRYFSRPYKYPDESFRRASHPQKSLGVADEESGLVAAERALHSFGYKPERVVHEDHFSIFAERSRVSELAVYIVHASLLLIFFGTVVDGLWGWRGTLNLNEGQTSNIVELRNGSTRTLPFSIRCDAAGQENYKDGTPKKWWSKLAVVEDGRDVQKKEIVVNDPLFFSGVRFYQSSYGPNGKVDKLMVAATPANGSGEKREFGMAVNDTVPLDADTTVRFAEFFPDYAVQDGQVYRKSNQLENPAAHLVVTSKSAGKNFDVWFPEMEGIGGDSTAPYQFQATDLKMGYFTGLQVSHEPGQWGVWAGVVLMVVGLAFVFYVVHVRIWVVPFCDRQTGKYSLWIGGSVNRNRDAFEERFSDLVAKVEDELKTIPATSPGEKLVVVVGD